MDRRKFCGAFTALITPFTSNGIDETAYKKLIDWQIAQGINGVVPCVLARRMAESGLPFAQASMTDSL